jgi:hypothetical protein
MWWHLADKVFPPLFPGQFRKVRAYGEVVLAILAAREVVLMPMAYAQPGLRPHDRRRHAPFLGLVLGLAVEEGLGVREDREDVELAQGHTFFGRLPYAPASTRERENEPGQSPVISD